MLVLCAPHSSTINIGRLQGDTSVERCRVLAVHLTDTVRYHTSIPQYLHTSYLLADLPYTLHIRSQLELITSIDLKVTGRDTAEL